LFGGVDEVGVVFEILEVFVVHEVFRPSSLLLCSVGAGGYECGGCPSCICQEERRLKDKSVSTLF
jgi:hypothetical protein